jgi:hypothetical protein
MSSLQHRSWMKLAVLREAAAAGAQLKSVTDVILGHNSAVGGAVTALFGGSLAVDAFQCFHLETAGVPHLYVQPYSGLYPLPGEHHAWLQGTLRGPASWESGMFSECWQSPDPATSQALARNGPLTAALRSARWEWRIGRGEINYAWHLQTRPFRGGLTHLAMKATGRVGVVSLVQQAGFIELLEAARAMQPSLVSAPGYTTMHFVTQPSYDLFFEKMLDRQLPPSAPPPITAPADFSAAIMQALSVAPANKLLLHPLAPVKDNTVRAFVLPPAARHLPIVAFVDSTLMGSAKEGLAMTPTHAFYKVDEHLLSFAYPEVRGVRAPASPTDGSLAVNITNIGELALPTADRAGTIGPLFHWFSQMP